MACRIESEPDGMRCVFAAPLVVRLVYAVGVFIFGALAVTAISGGIKHGFTLAGALALGVFSLRTLLELCALLARQSVRLVSGRVEYAWLVGPVALLRVEEQIGDRRFVVVSPAPFLSLRLGSWSVGLSGSRLRTGTNRSRATATQLVQALNEQLDAASASAEQAHPADSALGR